jgi:DNA polymerase-3 subunit delta'
MPLPPLYGHEGLRNRLANAIAAGRLPQALLLEGPRAVGKQRLGLWIAQTLLCEREVGAGEPCGECHSCGLVLKLGHPDLHWFFPVEPRRKPGDADKQVELIEEALAEELGERRKKPLYEAPSGLASHGIAAVRLLLRRLTLTPAMGRHKVFIVGDAERLVAQPGADQAANALLKGLEEPPHDTQFVLTTSDADALLPTILSRVVRVRVQRLPDSVVTAFGHHELDGNQLPPEAVTSAGGCPGRLIAWKGPRQASTGVDEMMRAVRGTQAARYAQALGRQPFQARGAFTGLLDGMIEQLRREARRGGDTADVVRAMSRVLEARAQAQGNVNPQLIAAVLANDLAGAA